MEHVSPSPFHTFIIYIVDSYSPPFSLFGIDNNEHEVNYVLEQRTEWHSAYFWNPENQKTNFLDATISNSVLTKVNSGNVSFDNTLGRYLVNFDTTDGITPPASPGASSNPLEVFGESPSSILLLSGSTVANIKISSKLLLDTVSPYSLASNVRVK